MSQTDPNPSCVQCGEFCASVSDLGLCLICEGSAQARAAYERELGVKGALLRLYISARRLCRIGAPSRRAS